MLIYLVYDSLESLGVVYCEVGEHLTVNLDTSLVQGTHQLAVAHILQTSGSIDTLYPECTESAFLVTTVAIGVCKTFLPGILSYGPNILPCAEITLGEFQNSCSLCF